MDQVSKTDSLVRGVWRVIRATALVFLIALCVGVQGNAQSDSGKVVGTVTDQTGAVIVGATLTLTNGANGATLTSVSNSTGGLIIPAVPPGDYLAKIEAAGFQSESQPVTITVTQAQTLIFKLLPGSTAITVTVTSAAPQVDTTDATMGATIEGKQVDELPLNGRNTLNLALLSPGVTQGTYGQGSQDTVQRNGESGGELLSVNGMREQANNFIMDGVDNNDGLQNIIVFFPPVEATQEFKIATSIAPAEFGRAGGALIVSSTKSGTNQIHGAASEFYRSGKFDSNPNYRFLINNGGAFTPNPPYNRNQWGGL